MIETLTLTKDQQEKKKMCKIPQGLEYWTADDHQLQGD